MKRLITLVFLLIIPFVLIAADVYWEPANPVAGGDVTIYYNRDVRGIITDPVYLHIGYNNWVNTQDLAMIESGDYFTYTYTIPLAAQTVNFVFTNAAQDSWDSNSGLNWNISLSQSLIPANPQPHEPFVLTLSNVSKPGSIYWYVETYEFNQLPLINYRPSGTIVSSDQRAVETAMIQTGVPNQYSVSFPAFNSGQQVVDKIKYTFHYSDDTWDGRLYEIGFTHDESFVSFTSPTNDANISSGSSVTISGALTNINDIKIWGGQELLDEISGNSFNYVWSPSQTHNLTCFGEYWITIQGINNSTGEISFARRRVDIEENPPQVSNGSLDDGATTSGSNVTIALYAPGVDYVSVKGDWNSTYAHGTMMNENGDGWWWYTSSLSSGKHSFQYEVYDAGFGWTKYLADPYSKELIWTSPGSNSESGTYSHARTVFYINTPGFSWSDGGFTPPEKEKFIIYETHVGDFSGEDNFEGDYSDMLTKIQSGYFNDLGVNAVEFLPLHAFGGEMSWGYNPAFYMAPPNCYGTPTELKTLINAFHENGIAVILDVVFNHTYGASSTFQLFHDEGYYGASEWRSNHDFTNDPYYKNGDSEWGYPLDHSKDKTRDLIDETLTWWVNEYHVDGFRFDHPHDMIWDNADYGNQHYSWAAKQANADLLIIAEEDQVWGINNSNFDSQWDFSSHHTFKSNLAQIDEWGNMDNMAGAIYHDGHSNHWGPVKYTESHDESRIMYECMNYQGMTEAEAVKKSKLGAVIMFTCTGLPMMYHGQEFGQNAAKNGTDPQPLQWDNLNTTVGSDLYDNYQKLIDLRKNSDALTDWVLETKDKNSTDKTIVYWRDNGNEKWVIAANFDDNDHTFSIEFPVSGNWTEVMSDQNVQINSDWYGNYNLPASEARIFKYSGGNVYVPGNHNDWDLDGDNVATVKSNLGGGTSYLGKTIQSSVESEFAIVYDNWDNKWCNGFWVTGYDQKFDFGFGGGNAIWKSTPINFIHICMQNPGGFLNNSLPIGIMTLSEYPAEIVSVETDFYYQGELTLHIRTNDPICAEEKIYIRIAPDGDYNSDIFVEATGSGTDYYASVSGLVFNDFIDYYALTTTLAYADDNDLDNFPDLMTINYNTNNGQNYQISYDASLAVELSEFKADYKKNSVSITWRTESEINNRGFNLYRKSSAEEDFIKINRSIILGAGNSSEPVNYSYNDTEIVSGQTYFYKLEDIEFGGKSNFSREISVTIPERNNEVPVKFDIKSLYPNPFNPTLTIDFEVPENNIVNIAIYDLKGQKVQQLVNEAKSVGKYSVKWNATEHSSGIYFVKMTTNSNSITKRCVLIK